MTYWKYAVVMICPLCMHANAGARDFFLTIGGGYAPPGNQASLEKNVLFYQRVLEQQRLDPQSHTIFFADGQDAGKDLQVIDATSVPAANRLMAEFFGTNRDLGLSYRNHAISGVRASTHPANIRRWFQEVGPTMQPGDRLILYVTGHGERSDERSRPYNTTISLWNNQSLSVTEVVQLLDQLPTETSVVAVMVQCYTGGFARFIYNQGDPDAGFSSQPRCGFFATLHDREAAGCTSEIDEATYVEYSTYFWEALSGRTRTGQPVVPPDYDRNGTVTFNEAHAYTVLKADTIDMPIKTSGEFLGEESLFANDKHPELLSKSPAYETVIELATPSERAILSGLSRELDLSGSNRIRAARQEAQPPRRGSRNRSRRRFSGRAGGRLRQRIANDLEQRWPELANVLNPRAIEFLTTRSAVFVQAVEQHPNYQEYRKQRADADESADPQKRRVKHERFIRTAENVILRENLKRLDDPTKLARYQAIVEAESASLASTAIQAPAP